LTIHTVAETGFAGVNGSGSGVHAIDGNTG
jgi:hypothetical protein